jgi:hypothetical protein
MWLSVLISIFPSLILGVLSNWVYDLLRNAGFLPDHPSLKRVLVILIALLPLVLLVALPDTIPLPVIVLSIIFLVVLLINLDNWISPGLSSIRNRRRFRNLSSSELEYLYQFIRHEKLTIVFDETDPVVGLLQTKGIIYPSPLVDVGWLVRYKCSFDQGEPFSISPTDYQYLTDHPELFRNVVSEEKP